MELFGVEIYRTLRDLRQEDFVKLEETTFHVNLVGASAV